MTTSSLGSSATTFSLPVSSGWRESGASLPLRATEGVGSVGLPRQEQVPAAEQLGDRALQDVDAAREDPVHDEQAEVGGTLFGRGCRRSPLARAEPLGGD